MYGAEFQVDNDTEGGEKGEEKGTPTYHLFAVTIRKEVLAKTGWCPEGQGFRQGKGQNSSPLD